MTSPILLSLDRLTEREFFYIEQEGEFILYFIDRAGKRNFYPTLFTSLESVIEFYLFVTKQEAVSDKVLSLACTIITSRQRPRSIESAIIKAFQVDAIQQAMKTETVNFCYLTTSGSKRQAKGSNCINLIPTDKIPTGDSSKKKNPLQIRYFDFERNAYRSFLASNIIY